MAETKSVALGIGIGCALVIFLLVIGAGSCGVWLYRQGRQIEDDMEDPSARLAKALDVLGTDVLPEGYYPLVGFSIPFVLRTAILSDIDPGEGKPTRGFNERGFIFVETLGVGQDEQQLRDYFEGRLDDPDVLEDNGIDMDVGEILRRGVLDVGGVPMMFVTQRANIGVQGYEGRGLSALVLVDCPEDQRRRVAIWFGPDPAPDTPLPDLDVAGTPADEATLAAFLGNFSFCRR